MLEDGQEKCLNPLSRDGPMRMSKSRKLGGGHICHLCQGREKEGGGEPHAERRQHG